MKRIMIMGPQGVGKGSLCYLLSAKTGAYHLSTGNIFRTLPSSHPMYDQVQQCAAEHSYVPDDITLQLVMSHERSIPEHHSMVLYDGFPRTVEQYNQYVSHHNFDCVVVLTATDDILVDRLRGRWIHESSGRIYHTVHNPPINPGYDDITGEPLVRREDDQDSDSGDRIHRYYNVTFPIIDTIDSQHTPVLFFDTEQYTLEDIANLIIKEVSTMH